MMRLWRLLLLFVVIGFGLSLPVRAGADAYWQSFERLDSIDRLYAAQALAPNFGGNPGLWPDWLDPRAVLIPITHGQGDLLVIRQPLHAPCGQFGFTVFGPASPQGGRDRLGGDFCAGDLVVVPTPHRWLPDLRFVEGRQKDAATGQWRRKDQRVRWTGTDWVLILDKG